jgi:hypothetical protein
MREGFARDDEKVEETRRRRASAEIIDADEAPQVVIPEEERIEESEAKAYVAEQEGVKDKKVERVGKVSVEKVEKVSLGMKRKKGKEGVKKTGEDMGGKEQKDEKKKQPARKEKKLKLSFEED